MRMFQKMGDALARFRYGRNGMDQLNKALFVVYLVVWIVEAVFGIAMKNALLARVAEAVTFVLMIVIFFRMFSKNLYKRQAENQRWLNWRWSLRSRSASAKARHMDKEHKYFTCKNCKAICRVPVGKGNIVITCPRCGEQIKART